MSPLIRNELCAEPRAGHAEHAPAFVTNDVVRMKARAKAIIEQTALAWGLCPGVESQHERALPVDRVWCRDLARLGHNRALPVS
jgi:hypothetical protein